MRLLILVLYSRKSLVVICPLLCIYVLLHFIGCSLCLSPLFLYSIVIGIPLISFILRFAILPLFYCSCFFLGILLLFCSGHLGYYLRSLPFWFLLAIYYASSFSKSFCPLGYQLLLLYLALLPHLVLCIFVLLMVSRLSSLHTLSVDWVVVILAGIHSRFVLVLPYL